MDPMLERQAALAYAITQGRVKWTKKHRDTLKALVEHKPNQYSPEILNDLLILLETMCYQLKINLPSEN